MKGKVTNARVGKTHTPMGTNPGKGAGAIKRDSAVATNVSSGGGTKHLVKGQVTRSKGSFSKYG